MMNPEYYYPRGQFKKKYGSCSLVTLALIFDILCSVFSLLSIYLDCIFALYILGDAGLIYCIIFSIFSIIKYSSIIFDWVIFGIYQSKQSLSPNFIKVSIIILTFYLVCLCPYTLLFVFMIIGRKETFIRKILSLFFNLYLDPHYLLITSIIFNLKLVNSLKVSKDLLVLENEMKKLTQS